MCKNGPIVDNKFTWEEVKKHNTPEDAWVVYFNKVYDVSNWYVDRSVTCSTRGITYAAHFSFPLKS